MSIKPTPVMVRGVFYHHLQLGVRIHFERVTGRGKDEHFAVTCNGNILGYTCGDTTPYAERVFADLQRMIYEPKGLADDFVAAVTVDRENGQDDGFVS